MAKAWGTNDMALAAYVSICLKRQPSDLHWFEDGKGAGTCFFVFADSAVVRQCAKDFGSGKAAVDPRVFTKAYDRMKRRMFQSNKPPAQRAKSA